MLDVTDIARVAHEVKKSYCEAIGHCTPVDWEQTPDEIKNSAINGVLYHINNPDSTPESSHENWVHMKKTQGWRYGEQKDVEKKTHPAMVPFDSLDIEQRVKDWLFRAIVRALEKYLKRHG